MRYLFCLAAVASVCLGVSTGAAPQSAPQSAGTVPTHAKDVAPILFKHCTSCYSAGRNRADVVPDVRATPVRGRAIRDKVDAGTMPPWHTDMPRGTFLNERGLTAAEKSTIRRWVANGAPKGNPGPAADAPVSAGVVDRHAGRHPGNAGGVQGSGDGMIGNEVLLHSHELHRAEVGAGHRSQAGEPGGRAPRPGQLQGSPRSAARPALKFNDEQMRIPRRTPGSHPAKRDNVPARLIATYAPGTNPQVFRPGTAMRLEPGGVVELQMHYTANGEAASDRTKVGLIFSKDPSPREVRAAQFFNATLSLPAGAANVAVNADVEFLQDATVWGSFRTRTSAARSGVRAAVAGRNEADDPLGAAVRFQLADLLHVRGTVEGVEGRQKSCPRVVRQLSREPIEPRPGYSCKVGRSTWEEMQSHGILFTPSADPSTASVR